MLVLPFDEEGMLELFRKIVKADFSYPNWFPKTVIGKYDGPFPFPSCLSSPLPRGHSTAMRTRSSFVKEFLACFFFQAFVPFGVGCLLFCLELLNRILEPDPKKRATIAEIKQHPWVAAGCVSIVSPCRPSSNRSQLTRLRMRIFIALA
jgi:serine/threonine protein kinase